MIEPTGELRDLVNTVIGAPATYRFCGWPHGATDVWEVSVDGDVQFYLKRHKLPGKFTRERRCYEEWLSQLPFRTPQLTAVFEGASALLLGALPGVRMEDSGFDAVDERAIHREAGRFQAALNAIPYDDSNDVPLADELADRVEGWLAYLRDDGTTDADDIDWAAGAFHPEVFRDVARVPSHRDFQPRNWMVDTSSGEAKVGFFDFEHATTFLWFLSIVKLWDRSWIGRPDLESAFWEGYGRTLAPEEQEQFRQTCILHAIGVIWWSQKNGDKDYAAHGRRVFERVKSETQNR